MSQRKKPVFPVAIARASVLLLVSAPAAIVESQDKDPAGISLYDSDQSHLWNRVHSALLIRVGPDGRAYGEDRLEPLLWTESNNLVSGDSARRAVAVLEEFLHEKDESLVNKSLKRAILQRDLWLVFNSLTHGAEASERKRLKRLLAKVIRQVALSPEQITKLPDNYAAAVASRRFADRFDPEDSERSYLPPELFKPDGPWVCIGRTTGPIAPLHLDESGSNRFTNSVFLIFLKFPAGRNETLDFLKRLAAFDKPLYLRNTDDKTKRFLPNLPNPALPQWPKGTEVALVRRAMLIDATGRIVASPLTESVQLRVMRTDTPAMTAKTVDELYRGAPDAQAFTEFQLRRTTLFAGESGGLRDVSRDRDFKTGFTAHVWDEFQRDRSPAATGGPFPERSQPFKNNRASCLGCHQYPGVYSFNSYHGDFPFTVRRDLKDEREGGYVPRSNSLAPMTLETVELMSVKWKEIQPGWMGLKNLLSE